MADPYADIFRAPAAPTRPSGPPNAYADIFRAAPAPKPSRIFSEGVFSIGGVSDLLRVGEYAVGGLLSGKGIVRGVVERTESAPEFKRLMLQAGLPDNTATRLASFAASLVLDPINLIGLGLPGKALRGVGLASTAAKVEGFGARAVAPVSKAAGRLLELAGERIPAVERAVRGSQGRKFLEPILEQQVIRESGGIERGVELARGIRTDARARAGTRRDAVRLDQALGGYFDAGADAMLSHLAEAQSPIASLAGSTSGGRIAAARQVGLRAQQAYLNSLPAEVRTFVQEWAPKVATQDADFAQQLVRVGMMKSETAAKWEGLHIRRIYDKFEDPQTFVEFLEKADPGEAAKLVGQLERGVPLRKVGQPIPTAVAKARELTTAGRRAMLGEIEQASSRVAAGGSLAAQAIARGEAYAEVAQKFAIPEQLIRSHPLASQLFRQIPDTAGWGQLAGKWLPKEIADPLLQLVRRPEGLDKFLQTTTGWFKFVKVVLNPATHARNIRTNVMLAHNAAGLGALNPATWARAWREVATNGQAFREAKAVSSAFLDTFTRSELRQFITDPTSRGVLAWFRRQGVTASRLYQFEEQLGKMAVYLTGRGRGLSPDAAAKLAEVALFNYRKVPETVARLRRVGIYPFLTFPYKVATETLPLAIRRPGRFSQQMKLVQAFSEPLTPDEQRTMPSWTRGGGYIKLPFLVNGHPVLYDLTYELPYGDIGETGTPITAVATAARMLRSGGSLDEALRTLTPLLTPIGQAAAEIFFNRSAFTGREILPPGETQKEQAKIIAGQLVRFAAPSFVSKTFIPGGELLRAIAKRPTPSGELPKPVPLAAASTFLGTRTVPLDTTRERRFRRLEFERTLQDIDGRRRAVARNQALTDAQRTRRLADLAQLRRAAVRRYQETGSVQP